MTSLSCHNCGQNYPAEELREFDNRGYCPGCVANGAHMAHAEHSAIATVKERGNSLLCVAIGVACLVGALYFLVLNPGSGGDIVNLQKMTLGETLGISGAVFFAAAWRPRA
jgi:hypothetical protein